MHCKNVTIRNELYCFERNWKAVHLPLSLICSCAEFYFKIEIRVAVVKMSRTIHETRHFLLKFTFS